MITVYLNYIDKVTDILLVARISGAVTWVSLNLVGEEDAHLHEHAKGLPQEGFH